MPRKKNKSPYDVSTCHAVEKPKTATESNETETQMFEKFEEELKWCVWKLEKQLSSKSLSQKQTEQTTKTLKSLTNPKSTLIKKRVLMRTVFGDYRKLMKDEEEEFARSVKEMTVTRIEPSDLKLGRFFKKCSSTTNSNKGNDSLHFAKSDNSFKFNFVTRTEEDLEEEEGNGHE